MSSSALMDFQAAAACAAPKRSAQPWNDPTSGAQYVHKRGSLVMPAPNNALQLITQYKVPTGQLATLTHVVLMYSGSGFIPGDATNLYFSLRLDSTYMLQDFEAVVTNLGSFELPFPIPGGVRLRAQQLVEALVTVPAGSPVSTGAGSYAHAFLIGYQWPEAQ
jgi:hypothetical protein